MHNTRKGMRFMSGIETRGAQAAMGDAKEFTVFSLSPGDIIATGCKCKKCIPAPPSPCKDCARCEGCTKCSNISV